MTDHRPRGIAGLRGREPIGCVLRIGRKGPRGFPTERDRLYIVQPYQDESGQRPPHPRFRLFNEADPSKRKLVLAQLVHHTQEDCWEYYLRAQMGPKGGPQPPSRAPWCEGNGREARRYFGLRGTPSGGGEPEDDWRQVPCPGDRCEFRQRVGGKVACKPFGRLLFRLTWPAEFGERLPSMLCKLSTHSWNSIGNILGLFESLQKAAAVLGLERISLMGYPFTIGLVEKTGNLGGQRTRFPVLVVTPQVDPITFLLHQAEQREALLAAPRPLAITDSTPAEEYEDSFDITPGLHAQPQERP